MAAGNSCCMASASRAGGSHSAYSPHMCACSCRPPNHRPCMTAMHFSASSMVLKRTVVTPSGLVLYTFTCNATEIRNQPSSVDARAGVQGVTLPTHGAKGRRRYVECASVCCRAVCELAMLQSVSGVAVQGCSACHAWHHSHLVNGPLFAALCQDVCLQLRHQLWVPLKLIR